MKSLPKFVIYKPVFYPSLILIVSAIALALIFRNESAEVLNNLQLSITKSFGWFFILAVNFILVFCIYLAFSKFGSIRLGGENAKPEFTFMSWLAMLFSAGMGIGIMFFGVAEPVSHYANPPQETLNNFERASQAIKFTNLHYGFHAWGVYSIVGLALAFFSYNKKLPLTFRSLFYPFLGEKIHGLTGHIIDILSVLATIFGLATTLGFGVQQMNAGLNFLFNWEISTVFQSWIIILVTSIATISVISGIDKGVKILSQANMILAFSLLLFVFALGPTVFLLKSYVQNLGAYLGDFINLSTWNDSYQDSGWQNSWTVFYWAWWIAWSPFVGSFIAKISKGRTIKEFILGVLLVPATISTIWMTVFGGTALHEILQGDTHIIDAVHADISTALFIFFQDFPFTNILSVLAVILVAFFFITSSDSGSLVIDNITSGSSYNTPALQRVMWAFLQGIIAIVLLLGGGLSSLQAGVIITGLPFTVILCVMCYSLHKGLQEEYVKNQKRSKSVEERNYADIITGMLQKGKKK
ncbi:MAG: BCCT family transporter [Ginsengibacter sp.]